MREKRHAARRAARTAVTSRFVVLTGLSGSGKSQAIRALEDLGYFCVDNLPVTLLPMLAELTLRAGTEISRAAVVVDVREGKMLKEFPRVYRRLKMRKNLNPALIFLEAAEPTLVRRFSETRRPHPLSPDRSAIEGIREERTAMRAIRKLADHVVDTTEMTVHELRHAFTGVAAGVSPGSELVVTILSFGFKHGIPVDSDLLFDVRFLPNPHFVPGLRPHTGRDPEVVRYLDRSDATHKFLEHTLNLLKFLIPQYAHEGKRYLTIGIGCTGGRHRSVAIADALRKGLTGITGVRLRVKHRDIANDWWPRAPSPPVRASGLVMKLGIVVVTHGQLATELVNSAEMIVGDLPHFAAVSIGWHQDVDLAREEIQAAIARVGASAGGTESEPADVLVLTDLFGGTPANLAVTFVSAHVEVITGVNLPMLIKLARPQKAADLPSLAREMGEHGRNAIWVASDLLKGEKA